MLTHVKEIWFEAVIKTIESNSKFKMPWTIMEIKDAVMQIELLTAKPSNLN